MPGGPLVTELRAREQGCGGCVVVWFCLDEVTFEIVLVMFLCELEAWVMDVIFGILLILAVFGFLFMRYFNTVRPIMDSAEDSNSTDTETVSTENPSPAVTTAPSRSTSAVTSAPSRTTIPGGQRIDTTPMTDRQLWEQIEYNTRMSADVLHRMWVLVVTIMVLNFIGVLAMLAFQ